jgi:hypothetical protein
MGFFSEVDIEIREMIADGGSREQVAAAFPMVSVEELDRYFANDHDGDESDGQPTEYEEWQDYMGGDDWDHGQYDTEY